MQLGPADPSNGYPRPMLQRDGWASLNGQWSFALDSAGEWTRPKDVVWDRRPILVPFAPETSASGIHDVSFFNSCWYKRSFVAPPRRKTQRAILHFGAVDYEATVWIDDAVVAQHRGGYTPFEVDITDFLSGEGSHVVTVRAHDDPHDLAKPRGKQDWQLEPHSIWYRRTTGIWQTVWIEIVPVTRIARLQCESSLERWEIDIDAELGGPKVDGASLEIKLTSGETVLAADVYAVIGGTANRAIRLSDPGIDDSRNELLWNPAHPRLLAVDATLRDGSGNVIDAVRSYTALRSVSVEGDRFLLNGRPFFLRMVLDQGYWPSTGLTPPDDAALRRDVELAKAMGFNAVRKHQKIEDPRYLYWADVLGLLVWEEMPSAYRFTTRSVERLTKEWINVIERDRAHPCIAAWVPINESWGVPNLPRSPTERDYVRALYHLTKTFDPSRPVIGNDGWESVATDIIGIHDYDNDPSRIARRYHADEVLPRTLKRERPAGRLLILEGQRSDVPLVLSEFGGISLGEEEGTWGYSSCATLDEFGVRYAQLLEMVRSLGLLCGFCYTQFADTYQEANGLLRADRTPKLPLEFISAATLGPRSWPLFLQEGAPGAAVEGDG